MSNQTESVLIWGIVSGDEESAGEFVERYRPQLESVARRLVASECARRDAVQKTISEAILQIRAGRFRGAASVGTWLISILRRTVADYHTVQYRERGFLRLDDHRPHDSALMVHASQEVVAAVRQALERLPILHRTVLWLNQVEGLTTDQIARRLKRPPGTIGKILWRSKAMFAESYGAEEIQRVERLIR